MSPLESHSGCEQDAIVLQIIAGGTGNDQKDAGGGGTLRVD